MSTALPASRALPASVARTRSSFAPSSHAPSMLTTSMPTTSMPTTSMLATSLCGILLVGSMAACGTGGSDEPGSSKRAKRDAKTAATTTMGRPPFPNMATAAWGAQVIARLTGEAPPDVVSVGYTKAVERSLIELHSEQPGAEQQMGRAAAAAYLAAKTDGERGGAAALAGVALVLDPVVDGYKDRLTDAAGLAALAASLDGGLVLGQAARAHIAAASGAVDVSKKLVELLESAPGLDGASRAFVALARHTLGERSDALVADLRGALLARPDSVRMRALLGQTLIDLGWTEEAVSVVTAGRAPHPWLDAIHGRALSLMGSMPEAIALLRAADKKIDEGHRGDVLYWLGRALAATPPGIPEARSIANTLATRPGFERESRVLEAYAAHQSGTYLQARRLLEEASKGAGISYALTQQILWGIVDACAPLHDAACVDDFEKRAVALDDDRARGLHAHVALALLDARDAGPPDTKAVADVDESLRRAHMLSPFDPDLGTRTGIASVPGGPLLAARVRAARRSLIRGARVLTLEQLDKVTEKACRVCRALVVEATTDRDEAARRAVATLDGLGPPLDESDAVRVIAALAASPNPTTKRALALLDKDERPAVQEALTRARTAHLKAETDAKENKGAPQRDGAKGKAAKPSAPAQETGEPEATP